MKLLRFHMTSRFTMAVHALGMLACEGGSHPGGVLSSAAIARSVRTNPVVVRRVLADLRRAGLVETRRGARGGVALARPPSRITLGCVWEAVNDGEPLFAGHPAGPDPRCPTGLAVASYLAGVRGRAEKQLVDSLRKVTLADLRRDITRRIPNPRGERHA
jgi:Rrf2 family protein